MNANATTTTKQPKAKRTPKAKKTEQTAAPEVKVEVAVVKPVEPQIVKVLEPAAKIPVPMTAKIIGHIDLPLRPQNRPQSPQGRPGGSGGNNRRQNADPRTTNLFQLQELQSLKEQVRTIRNQNNRYFDIIESIGGLLVALKDGCTLSPRAKDQIDLINKLSAK